MPQVCESDKISTTLKEMKEDFYNDYIPKNNLILENIDKLNCKDNDLIEREETYIPKSGKQKGIRLPTGNTTLETTCGYCEFRAHCWPKAVLHEKVTSKAKSKPLVWYNKLKNTEVKNI